MNKLQKLLKKKPSGKLNLRGEVLGTDKSTKLHGYLDYYELLFPKPENVDKVVELGLQRRSGEWKNATLPSINMWLEFFNYATIFGFDAQDLCSEDPRFIFYKGQQGRMKHHMEFGQLVGWDVDVVIDDCSHRPTDSLLSLLFFWPRIKSGGFYIVEDTQAVVQREYDDEYKTVNYFEQYLLELDCYYEWVPSLSAGEKSSLIIMKK